MNLLILGGAGFIGSALCERLVDRFGAGGARLTVPSRRPQRCKHLVPLPTVEVVGANIHDPAALARLVEGRDAVINLVGILHGGAADFERAHVELPRKLAAACSAAGVRRVIHVSAIGASAQAPSHYLRSKAAGEAVLSQAGIDLTVLRPSVVFGAGDSFLNLFATLQAWAPMLPLAGADARFQPVWVEDLASAIVRSLENKATIGRVYECAGPRVYTLAELARLAGQWSGHVRPVFGVPTAVGRVQAALLGLLPGEPLMSADNLASMEVPNVASGALPGLAQLGIQAGALEAIGPSYLSAGQGSAHFDALRACARRR